MALSEGIKAPAFTGVADGNTSLSLKDFRGSWVVLYFYPEDDTPTCTAQACSFRDNMKELKDLGVTVIGVSPNTHEDHDRFIAKYGLNFRLVADPQKTIINKYDVWKEKTLYGRKFMGIVRTTYLIDPKGVIQKAWANVRHAHQIQQLRTAITTLHSE